MHEEVLGFRVRVRVMVRVRVRVSPDLREEVLGVLDAGTHAVLAPLMLLEA